MNLSDLRPVLLDQSGLIARRQVLALGGAPHDLRRMVRRRELAVVAPGVLADHTGDLTWLQRAWRAVLATSEFGQGAIEPMGSGLSHESALRIAEGAGRRGSERGPIHVLVDASRRLDPPAGVVVHRTRHLADRLLTTLAPPRTRYEHALLDVACGQVDALDSIELLSRAVGDRRTTAERLLAVSGSRSRVPRRTWIEAVLQDVAGGTCSVLEHGFVTKVERPHGLPVPRRQSREVTPIGVVYRDAAYGGLLLELDGRLSHGDVVKRDADLDRDLFAAVDGAQTIRLGWGQVFQRSCRTAWALGAILKRSQAVAAARPCGPGCPVGGPLNVEHPGHHVA